MRWQLGRRSSNVENLRGLGGGKAAGGGGLILVGLVVWALGGNPMAFFAEGASRMIQRGGQSTLTAEQEQQQVDFVSVVLASTEDTWTEHFGRMGVQYPQPALVLFTGYVNSGCGNAQSAMGPFYCPRDQKLYLDLEFFQTMETQLGAPGDFARAYVIAHEVGHHIQHRLGLLDASSRDNAASVRTELQADCLAGIWAHDANRTTAMIEPGDIEEALNAASQIGDDVLQKKAQGHAVPDSFTHGTSAQRNAAFRRGFESGELTACGIALR